MSIDSIKTQAAGKGVYNRGLALYYSNAVTFTSVEPGESDLVKLTGRVSGNYESFYTVELTMDALFDTVDECYCSCPAFAGGNGLCKHCVAMALAYHYDPVGAANQAMLQHPFDEANDEDFGGTRSVGRTTGDANGTAGYPEDVASTITGSWAKGGEPDFGSSFTGGSAQYSSASSSRGAKANRYARTKAPVEAETSLAITDVISAYAKRAERDAKRVAAVRAAAEEGANLQPVTLVPTISHDSDTYSYSSSNSADRNWSLKLRIQRGKQGYVVKHVDELVEAWQQGSHVEYGKNLAFTHVRSAFDERSNQLLELISQVVKAQQAMFLSRDKYWYAGRGTHIKELPISSEDAVKLLDLYQGDAIQYICEGFSNKPHPVQVVEGDCMLDVEIARGETGGYDLLLPKDAECMIAGERMYLIFGGKARNCPPELVAGLGEFFSTVLPAWHPMHIRETDMTAFCAAVLPELRKHTNLVEAEGVGEFTPAQAEFVFRVSLDEHGFVSCTTQVMYGLESVNLFEDATPDQPVRHVSREIEAQQLVRAFFPQGDFPTPRYDQATSRRNRNSYGSYGSYYSSDPWSSRAYGSYDDYDGYGRYGSFGGRGGAGAYGTRASRQVSNEPCSPWFHEDDAEAMFTLLTEGYAELSRAGELLVSENLSGREVLPAPSVSVTANVRSGLLDIAVDSAGLAPAELMAYLAAYRRKQRFVRLANGSIMRIGEQVQALADLADGLGLSEKSLVEGVDDVPANRTLFVDALLKRSGVRFNRNEAFRSIVRDFDTVEDGDFEVPASLAQTMRQYQCDGFQWLSTLGKLGFGGILADDMGLGKTLQMIAYLLAHKRDAPEDDYLPSLVVCPASLVYNWEAEVHRFAPELDVATVTGTKAERSAIIGGAGERDLLVTSYDLMKRDTEAYATQRFHCVVLDEAQYIKNRTTKAAKSAKQLPSQVRFALTGTPIENRLSELWSIFDFLMPGILGSHEQFAARFETAINAGDEASAKRLRALVGPFILRRLKGDVLADLPEKDENVVFAHMEGEQGKLYAANAQKLALQLAKQLPEEFAQDKLRILAELTKLRQICCDPHLFYDNYEGDSAKLETCMELVRNAVDGGHRILLFSQFTSMLDIIAGRLAQEGIGYLAFTGSTSKEERAARVARFQQGDVPVFLISLKAGGTGLNLTAADIVIHYDPWWNVAAQNQATDRAHRIGQTRNVSVFKLIAKGSIEENILQMQEEKRHLAEQVMGGEAIGSSKLTREDILGLLGAATNQQE